MPIQRSSEVNQISRKVRNLDIDKLSLWLNEGARARGFLMNLPLIRREVICTYTPSQ